MNIPQLALILLAASTSYSNTALLGALKHSPATLGTSRFVRHQVQCIEGRSIAADVESATYCPRLEVPAIHEVYLASVFSTTVCNSDAWLSSKSMLLIEY
jgi:hypothetical protein